MDEKPSVTLGGWVFGPLHYIRPQWRFPSDRQTACAYCGIHLPW